MVPWEMIRDLSCVVIVFTTTIDKRANKSKSERRTLFVEFRFPEQVLIYRGHGR